MTQENDAIKNLPENLPDDLKAVLELQKDSSATIFYDRWGVYFQYGFTILMAVLLGFQVKLYGDQFFMLYLDIMAILACCFGAESMRCKRDYQKQIELLKTVVLKLHEESLQRKKSAAI